MRVGIPLNGLTPTPFVPVLNQDMDFQRHISWSFFLLSHLRRDVVKLVDIGEIADHHYLCSLFNRVE
jgi:hypothetical protein